MKVQLYEQEVDVDLEDFGFTAAHGDLTKFSKMLVNFCDELKGRELAAGYTEQRYFDMVFGIMVESIDSAQVGKLKEIVNSLE